MSFKIYIMCNFVLGIVPIRNNQAYKYIYIIGYIIAWDRCPRFALQISVRGTNRFRCTQYALLVYYNNNMYTEPVKYLEHNIIFARTYFHNAKPGPPCSCIIYNIYIIINNNINYLYACIVTYIYIIHDDVSRM